MREKKETKDKEKRKQQSEWSPLSKNVCLRTVFEALHNAQPSLPCDSFCKSNKY